MALRVRQRYARVGVDSSGEYAPVYVSPSVEKKHVAENHGHHRSGRVSGLMSGRVSEWVDEWEGE